MMMQRATFLFRSSMIFVLMWGACSVFAEDPAPDQLTHLRLPENRRRYASYDDLRPVWPETYGAAAVALWRDGRLAAYSITIDDNNTPDFSFWRAAAEKYGWHFTWFVIVHPYVWDIYEDKPGSNTGYFGTLEQFGQLAKEGHDIQLHGACGAMNKLTEAQYEDHVARSIAKLAAATGQPVITYAYPCGKTGGPEGADYRRVIERHMIGARGTSGGSTPAHTLDYLQTQSLGGNAMHADGSPNGAFARLWNDERPFGYSQYRGWGVSLYHGLNNEQKRKQATATLDYIKTREEDGTVWVAPFTNVAKYAQERESATLETLAATADRIELRLTDRMLDTLFDEPLTVKVRLDESWTGLAAEQNGKPVPVRIVEHEGRPFAFVQAVPDRGPVVLRKQD